MQFGHPIGDLQALRFALADVVAQARASRQRVAHLLGAGEAAASEAPMVTRTATEMAVRVTDEATQLHGGNGYTTERRVERYRRDGRPTTIIEGTSGIERRIVSDRMLPRPRDRDRLRVIGPGMASAHLHGASDGGNHPPEGTDRPPQTAPCGESSSWTPPRHRGG